MTREETIQELGEWLEQMIQHGVPSHSAKRKALATAIALLSADTVEVVRCKDCIRTMGRDKYIGRRWCSIHRGYMEDTYYCADGLRREDGE